MFSFGKKNKKGDVLDDTLEEKYKEENFEKLVKLIIEDFSEEDYLNANIDVLEGIRSGQFRDVQHHLETFGLSEIQQGKRKFHEDFEPFNENRYHELNIDWSKDIECSSEFEHFCHNGYKKIIDNTMIWDRTNQLGDKLEGTDYVEDEIISEANVHIYDNRDTKVQNNDYQIEARNILSEDEELDISKWKSWLKDVPVINNNHCYEHGHIEIAASTKKIQSGIIVGWAIQNKESIIWLEDSKGNPYFLGEAYRIFRKDVHEAFYEIMTEGLSNTGFILSISGIKPGENISFKVLSSQGVHTLHSSIIRPIDSRPKEIAEWLFTIHSPFSGLSSRFTSVDWLLIDEVLEERQKLIMNMTEDITYYGDIEENKKVSVIIPLYGRIDFIEHQMLEFVQDAFIKTKVEIIYVIDDISLVEIMNTMCTNLYNLYQIPFKTVWGGLNRGYSGANNLGAKHANGEYLIFMNSDLFPNSEAWIDPLIEVLQENPDIGVVAPRLLFPDGSIQHAGIEFKQRSDLGVWINHHPYMGLDPSLEPNQSLTYVPAVTGACMVLRREDFDLVDGWDTGYLIGDFEDTDLCLKLYEIEKKSAYLPTVELTHLERQSFGSIGSDDFRTKLVILNATRHQNRWSELISEISLQTKGVKYEK